MVDLNRDLVSSISATPLLHFKYAGFEPNLVPSNSVALMLHHEHARLDRNLFPSKPITHHQYVRFELSLVTE